MKLWLKKYWGWILAAAAALGGLLALCMEYMLKDNGGPYRKVAREMEKNAEIDRGRVANELEKEKRTRHQIKADRAEANAELEAWLAKIDAADDSLDDLDDIAGRPR